MFQFSFVMRTLMLLADFNNLTPKALWKGKQMRPQKFALILSHINIDKLQKVYIFNGGLSKVNDKII